MSIFNSNQSLVDTYSKYGACPEDLMLRRSKMKLKNPRKQKGRQTVKAVTKTLITNGRHKEKSKAATRYANEAVKGANFATHFGVKFGVTGRQAIAFRITFNG